MTHNFPEDAIEVCQGNKPTVIGHLAHANIRIEQKILGPFDSRPGQIIGERKAGGLFEQLTKVKSADVERAGDLIQGNRFRLMFADESFGSRDHGRFFILLLNQNLISHDR